MLGDVCNTYYHDILICSIGPVSDLRTITQYRLVTSSFRAGTLSCGSVSYVPVGIGTKDFQGKEVLLLKIGYNEGKLSMAAAGDEVAFTTASDAARSFVIVRSIKSEACVF